MNIRRRGQPITYRNSITLLADSICDTTGSDVALCRLTVRHWVYMRSRLQGAHGTWFELVAVVPSRAV